VPRGTDDATDAGREVGMMFESIVALPLVIEVLSAGFMAALEIR